MNRKAIQMAERTKPITDKIAELDRQIDDFQRRIGEAAMARRALQEVLATMTGAAAPETGKRARVQNVKGTVLDIMQRAGVAGHTSAEVAVMATEFLPGVARDTISSVLSRLKTDGALTYDGLRYYDVKYSPKDGEPRPSTPHMRAVG